MSHKILRSFIVKVSILGYFPLASDANMYKISVYEHVDHITRVDQLDKASYTKSLGHRFKSHPDH